MRLALIAAMSMALICGGCKLTQRDDGMGDLHDIMQYQYGKRNVK